MKEYCKKTGNPRIKKHYDECLAWIEKVMPTLHETSVPDLPNRKRAGTGSATPSSSIPMRAGVSRVRDVDAAEDNPFALIVPFESEFDKLSEQWELENKAAEEAARASGERLLGECYLAWNPCFTRYVHKVGGTSRLAIFRVNELSRTSVPEPFQLIASFQCFEPFAMEKRIHSHFAAARRWGRRNEFFEITRKDALAYFEEMRREAMREAIGGTSRRSPRARSAPRPTR